MASQKQIAANRLNARKSTGPRTPEGKARSSQNALKSGIDSHAQIIHGESPAELDCLKSEYHDRFLPPTPEQRMLVDTLIDCEWLLRRFRRVEAELWVDGMRDRVHPTILGESFNRMDETFARLQRRIDMTQRNYRNALHQLERLRAEAAEQAEAARLDPDPEPELDRGAAPVTPRPQTTNPANGFLPRELVVSQNPAAETTPAPRLPAKL
jgi:hypothetical protein